MTEQVPQSATPSTPASGSASSASSYPASSSAPASTADSSGTYPSTDTAATYTAADTAGTYGATGYSTTDSSSGYGTGSSAGTYAATDSSTSYAATGSAGTYPSATAAGYATGSSGSYGTSGYGTSASSSGYGAGSYGTGTTAGSTASYAPTSAAGTYGSAGYAPAPSATTPLPPVTPAAHGYVQPYGAVAAAQAETKKRNTLLGVIIGLLIVILLAGAGTAFVLMSGILNPQEEPVAEVERPPLTDDQVVAALNAAPLNTPTISQYAYVSQEALAGPTFSDIVVNEPEGTTVPVGQVIESSAMATATFQNKGISIAIPVTLPFEYNPVSGSWVAGTPIQGDPVTTPLAAASAPEIVANLNQILVDSDPTKGESMADATVVKTTDGLTINGGTVTVELTKTIETPQEDKTINELRTCTVTIDVSWDNNLGWVAKVPPTGFGDIDSKINEIPKVEGAGDQTIAAAAAAEPADQMGTVKFGDTVKLTGTLQKVENAANLSTGNAYTNADASADAGGTVQLVLHLDRPVELNLNDKKYRLTTVAVAVNLRDDGASLVGRKAEVQGPIEEACATSWCPLGVKATHVNLTS